MKKTNTIMWQIRFVCFFLTVICSVTEAQKACSAKSQDDMDTRMAKIIAIGEFGRLYPESKKQLKTFCEDSSSYVKSLEEYAKKCFRGTLRQYSNIFIFSSKQSLKRFCGKNNKQVDSLLTASKCVNRNRVKVNRCMDKMRNNFIRIKYAKDNQKIPMMCCQYVELTECFRNSLDCVDERQIMEEVMRSVTSNFVDSTCGDYNEDTDKCSKLPRLPNAKANEKNYKSLLFPAYDIINSIKE